MAELGNKLSSGSWSSPEHSGAQSGVGKGRGPRGPCPACRQHPWSHRDPPPAPAGQWLSLSWARTPQLLTAHTGQGLPPLSEGLQNFTYFAFQKTSFVQRETRSCWLKENTRKPKGCKLSRIQSSSQQGAGQGPPPQTPPRQARTSPGPLTSPMATPALCKHAGRFTARPGAAGPSAHTQSSSRRCRLSWPQPRPSLGTLCREARPPRGPACPAEVGLSRRVPGAANTPQQPPRLRHCTVWR